MELTSEHFDSAGIAVLQPARGHRYGAESLALADFVRTLPGARVAELGSGVGLISLLIAARLAPREVVAVEIQPALHEIARRNVRENGYGAAVRCVNEDYRKFADGNEGEFECVVSNPPFYRSGDGRIPPDPVRAAARHEINGTVEELAASAHALLSRGGHFFVVFDARREEELRLAASAAGFGEIRIERPEGAAYVLAEFRKNQILSTKS
jgi:tRNA1Val (adenine37-N6)-methyltransferase